MDVGSEESKERMEFLKLDLSEWFGEDVANHVISRTVFQNDMPSGNGLVYEMEVDVNVLCASVECCILWKVNCALVVTEKSGR